MVIVLLSPDGLYEYIFFGWGGNEIQRATTYYWYHTVQQLIIGIIQYTNALNSDTSNN